MDFQLSEDQEALVSALQPILRDHSELPQDQRFSFAWHDAALQKVLEESGFLGAARDMGPVEAALVTYEVARGVSATETIGCSLVAPMTLPDVILTGPVALTTKDGLQKAIRNLTIAGHLLVDCGEDVALLAVDPAEVEAVESIYAFPYGRFIAPVDLSKARIFPGAGPRMRQWWRVAIAAEIMGAADAAIAFTLDYVKQRHVFGRAVGSFQSVQHRLVQRYGYQKAGYYLVMKAAWSGKSIDADVAFAHALQGIQAFMFDVHQFHGGMGVTTEHLLHFWTYKIRAVQAEAGGLHQATLAIAGQRWATTAAEAGA